VILLDTHAFLWLEAGHRRARPLHALGVPFYISPVTVLEMHMLNESGRFRFRSGNIQSLVHDERWALDDPPAARWFDRASTLTWTRDPLDRLIVAHALLRGWRLATADAMILEHLLESEKLEL
jgi:PIN domain nuclease of toxin-antitoxin system